MASSTRQGGIQQLLAAEQEAQHIVNNARNGTYYTLNILLQLRWAWLSLRIGLQIIQFFYNLFLGLYSI